MTARRTISLTRLSVFLCLDGHPSYTLHPAYASYQENIKGSIEVGKLADMIVLSDDILKIAPMDIHKLKVDMTMIDGIVEYER